MYNNIRCRFLFALPFYTNIDSKFYIKVIITLSVSVHETCGEDHW